MKIVLVGYMGSGKTSIGTQLAKDLKMSFLDLDQYIESALDMDISSIFKNKGEIFFRKQEYIYVKEIVEQSTNFVLATGGGTPCYGNNMDTITKETPYVFYLKLSIGALAERLYAERTTRPLINTVSKEGLPEFIGKHIFERNAYYAQAAHTITCDGKDIQTIITEIKTILGQGN